MSKEDPSVLEDFKAKHGAAGDYICLIGEAFYDSDTGDEKELQEAFMDAHGLLFELEEELTTILDPKNTHVAIGFAWSSNQVKVIQLFS